MNGSPLVYHTWQLSEVPSDTKQDFRTTQAQSRQARSMHDVLDGGTENTRFIALSTCVFLDHAVGSPSYCSDSCKAFLGYLGGALTYMRISSPHPSIPFYSFRVSAFTGLSLFPP